MPISPPLTLEQATALRNFALGFGRTWKAELRSRWQSDACGPIMQGLRNTHGPTWLASVRLSEIDALLDAADAIKRRYGDKCVKLDELCEHIAACADLWEKTGVSRVRTITRAAEEIRELFGVVKQTPETTKEAGPE